MKTTKLEWLDEEVLGKIVGGGLGAQLQLNGLTVTSPYATALDNALGVALNSGNAKQINLANQVIADVVASKTGYSFVFTDSNHT